MESVKVAVRVRPLVQSEIDMGCQSCIDRVPGEPQLSIGRNSQMFSFNYVFDEYEGQSKVYNSAVKPLIENLFKGYNLTILAYGQTGSGKTFTMGTNYSGDCELGVIPRAVYEIFEYTDKESDYKFSITCSFVELYNENLYDLLTDKPKEQSLVDMREQSSGICIPGLTEFEVKTPDDILMKLKEGSAERVVGSTAMNSHSSRSHAIFTINIRTMPKNNPKEVMTSKFHLVDLAGSERSKKTGATGDRFREGVNINKGLLVLGNVISQLGEGSYHFINYRDSKLTRLLQDSLGGNSVTLMIACVSPADYNHAESLNTLRYADRAKKIKNKPIVNQDPISIEMAKLRKENEELRLRMIGNCPPSHQKLESALEEADRKIEQLSRALAEALTEHGTMLEKHLLIEKMEEQLNSKLNDIANISKELTQENNDPNVAELKSKILELKEDKSKIDKALVNLEHGKHSRMREFENGDFDLSGTRHDYILAQAELNKEICGLTNTIFWKEELVAKLCANSQPLGEMETASQESLEELRQQIASLQNEKDELQKLIANSAKSTASNQAKLSEQRRKRLVELEQKVSELMKKVVEQERIITMKEKNEEKIKILKNEIMAGKQLKVRLIQQMKGENEKFRSWKLKKDQELTSLRTQNMKKHNQLKKMEQLHLMQQNVLKRKLEAAAAANKRIMAVLERQKAAKVKRLRGSTTEIIKEKVTEELELVESEFQAQRSLESLIQDRALLTRELSSIKESLVDPDLSVDEKEILKKNMKEIEEQLALRSAEISDIQQKLLDIHLDDKHRVSWDWLSSMSDAKFALTYLLSSSTDKMKELFNKYNSSIDLKEKNVELEMEIKELRDKLIGFSNYHKSTLEKIEKENEEKIHVLLQHLREHNSDAQDESIRIQVEEIGKIGTLRQKVKELEEKLELYKKTESSHEPATGYQDLFRDYICTESSNKKSEENDKENKDEAQSNGVDHAMNCEYNSETDNNDKKDRDWLHEQMMKRIESLRHDSVKTRQVLKRVDSPNKKSMEKTPVTDSKRFKADEEDPFEIFSRASLTFY